MKNNVTCSQWALMPLGAKMIVMVLAMWICEFATKHLFLCKAEL